MSEINFALGAVLAEPLALALPIQSAAQAAVLPDMLNVNCLARDTLNNYLDRAYGECRIAQAELDNGRRVEWSSPSGAPGRWWSSCPTVWAASTPMAKA